MQGLFILLLRLIDTTILNFIDFVSLNLSTLNYQILAFLARAHHCLLIRNPRTIWGSQKELFILRITTIKGRIESAIGFLEQPISRATLLIIAISLEYSNNIAHSRQQIIFASLEKDLFSLGFPIAHGYFESLLLLFLILLNKLI